MLETCPPDRSFVVVSTRNLIFIFYSTCAPSAARQTRPRPCIKVGCGVAKVVLVVVVEEEQQRRRRPQRSVDIFRIKTNLYITEESDRCSADWPASWPAVSANSYHPRIIMGTYFK